MKFYVAIYFIICSTFYHQHASAPSPLAEYSSEWNDPKYLKCNTAANAGYMSASEKEVIYILNLARTNPSLFANTVIKQYPGKTGKLNLNKSNYYYSSLLDTMKSLRQINLLYPDSLCYVSANCHAVNSGKEGYVGHERSTAECKKKKYFSGECCSYGSSKPLEIVMSLLIDEDTPSLGHRFLLLCSFPRIGVSIQPHKTYGTDAVIDFTYRE